jgi:hypothetical protein
MVRGAGGFGASSSSSSSEMTMPLLTRAVVAPLDSARLDVDDGFARVLAGSSSSESESFDTDFSFDREGLAASALDDAARGGSTGSALILRVSGAAGLGAAAAADFALPKKSSFPEGFGFAGSCLMSGLTSFGSDLTAGCAFSVLEGAFDRPGSLFLEVEAVAEDFAFAEDRVRWRSVRFYQ